MGKDDSSKVRGFIKKLSKVQCVGTLLDGLARSREGFCRTKDVGFAFSLKK